MKERIYDYVIIGSGFGGSVSAMRLAQKGYKVVVLERGKRYQDKDFAKTNWDLKRYLWMPVIRCFGILQMSLLNGLLVFHGSGVGGGSLVYAGVLIEPNEELFKAPAWSDLADWENILKPHYITARKMLGVNRNPLNWPADTAMQAVAAQFGQADTFTQTDVGVYFGNPDGDVPDPYFGGEGPPRRGCTHCGGCMVGCRQNAKNTLVKNYLFFAEKWGAEVRPEAAVNAIYPLVQNRLDSARYEVVYSRSTAWFSKKTFRVRARNVILSAGVLGTLTLLFHCRDKIKSLPKISQKLGDIVRTNNEALLGAIHPTNETDFSKGVAITSFFMADEKTAVEPVRFPAGSSMMRFMGAPLISDENRIIFKWFRAFWESIRHPIHFYRGYIKKNWAERTTIVLIMQTMDKLLRIRPGRNLFTLFRRGLVTQNEGGKRVSARIDMGHTVTRAYAKETGSIPAGSVVESLLNMPTTAHILGGCQFGRSAQEGVIDLDCQVHNYPGLYVVDGSIVPANPGVNPSLTITALAEYAMSQIPQDPTASPKETLHWISSLP